MIYIGRTIGPLIGTGQRRCGIMLVKAFARDRSMFQVGRQRLKSGRDTVPVVKRCLQCRRDMTGIGVPSEVVGYDHQFSVTA